MSSIRVFEYGLLPPHANSDLVDGQMVLAHRYRNMLVEIERERRARIREAMSAHPDVAPLEAQLRVLVEARDAMRQEILDQRRSTRSRSETPEQRKAVKDIAAQIRPLRQQVKALRGEVAKDSTVKDAMAAAEANAKVRVKAARKGNGVYWGTYLLQEQAADQARRSPTPPHFVRWRGEGRVSVQLQNGLPLEDIWGTDTQIQIAPVTPEAWSPLTRRGQRRRLSRTVLRLRIASDPRKHPVWAEWRMVMHRPLPQGAVVKVATVSRRRRDCLSWDWRLQLTVDTSACAAARPAPHDGVVALNLGFAMREGGAIRSGFLVGDDGMEREIVVAKSDAVRGMPDQASPAVPPGRVAEVETSPVAAPGVDGFHSETSHVEHGRDVDGETSPSALSGHGPEHDESSPVPPGHEEVVHGPNWIANGLSKADSIRSFRDKAMDRMKALMVPWRGGSNLDGVAAQCLVNEFLEGSRRARPLLPVTTSPSLFPEWFTGTTEHMHAWRSAERFRNLSYAWELQRFDGDFAAFELLRAWRERDEHLERYESGLRRSALRDRREGYRILAAQMARRYRLLVVDDTDLSLFQRDPSVESERVKFPAVKSQQRLAAGSELRGAMVNAFGPDRVVLLSHKDVTRRCHLCGAINHWDRAETDRRHSCDGCGATWDQDSNACRNLLAEHRVSGSQPREKRPSRSDRFKHFRANHAA